ncbi:acetylxylan esterase [Paenibacillus sp. J5C_2022]|uniref:acetylxylan esterase n=1 Tax=Paenibacillus sp. J5C2022 TaxID=2977129 RepID=UPI0021D077E3|nr:acetylxylan esterase [Paenibacillus sp. J5C2022]MCU6707213.1 acetylxylan esterase [Paenibacillus sp. J5C2022]
MNAIERRIRDLNNLRPDLTAREDLQQYWEETLQSFKDKPLNSSRTRVDSHLEGMEAYEVRFEGFDGTPIRGTYVHPAGKGERQWPCIVTYPGYQGTYFEPESLAMWACAGYAILAIDVRGQKGGTGSELAFDSGVIKGFVSQNITDKYSCYYRAILVDCLKGLEWAAQQPEVDKERVATVGSSQGGGLALLTAALSDVPSVAVAHVPNMCCIDYSMLYSTGSATELSQYCEVYPDRLEQVLETVSYFDMHNLADRIRIPVFVSVCLKDLVCMPETIFPMYNRIASHKEMEIYPFSGHTVGSHQLKAGMAFMKKHLARADEQK